jgi:hypothetical protein
MDFQHIKMAWRDMKQPTSFHQALPSVQLRVDLSMAKAKSGYNERMI